MAEPTVRPIAENEREAIQRLLKKHGGAATSRMLGGLASRTLMRAALGMDVRPSVRLAISSALTSAASEGSEDP